MQPACLPTVHSGGQSSIAVPRVGYRATGLQGYAALLWSVGCHCMLTVPLIELSLANRFSNRVPMVNRAVPRAVNGGRRGLSMLCDAVRSITARRFGSGDRRKVLCCVYCLSCLYWSVLHLVFRLRCLRFAAGDGKDVRWRKEERLRLLETGE